MCRAMDTQVVFDEWSIMSLCRMEYEKNDFDGRNLDGSWLT